MKHIYSLRLLRATRLLLFFAILIFSSQASALYWCGQIYPPQNPPPPGGGCCSDCDNPCIASPNFIAIGNYFFTVTDLQLPTRGLPLRLLRGYDSARMIDGPFGISWTSSFTGSLTEAIYMYSAPSTYYKEVIINLPNVRQYRFRQNPDGSYTAVPPNHYTLIKNADGTFELTLPQSRVKYNYAVSGLLSSQVDEFGNTLVFTYNGNGRLDRVTDGSGSGRYLEFIYGADGRVSTLRDSSNRTVSYSYNAQGAMTSSTDAASRQTIYGYVNGRFAPLLNQIKDHWNRVVTTITYDTADRNASYTEAGETYTYTYQYQGDPSKVSKTDSSNRTWVFTYDSNGYVISRVPPAGFGGGTLTGAYHSEGSPQYSIDEAGIKTSYTYNPDGSVATILRDDQGAQAIRFDYAYDPNFVGKVMSITPKNPSTNLVDPNWQAWQYDYYQAGSTAPGALHHVYRVRSDGSTLDNVATYTYNSAGQVLTVTDGSGAVTSYSYGGTTGDLATVTYPKNSDAGPNPVYQYGRDSVGRVTTVTDPLTHATTYTYDNFDRITSVTLPKPSTGSPLNFVTTYSYDNYDATTGLVFTHQTDPNAKLTKQGSDQFGQMVRSIDALNKLTIFTYTKGLLTSITDANNNVTSYAYNGIHRLVTTTFPNSVTETYTYYADGLLNTKTDRKSQTITYTYDRLKRLITKAYPNSTSITYAYTGQKLDSVSDTFSGETHSFVYDSSYRVTSNTQGSRGTLGYTYDATDRIGTYSVSGGPSATYNYYADGSLKNISWSPVVGQFDYQYSLTGQYSTISFPNGQSRSYTYDDQGRLTQLANTSLGTFSYGYDNPLLGQRTSMTSGLGVTNYSYDSNYQLTQANYPAAAPFNGEVHAWTYDNIGNRLTNTVNSSTTNYTYFKNGGNPLNGQRLQNDGTKTYTYDANGNVTGDGTYIYTWDYENRLTGISGGGITASYTYDYAGRRKSKTINSVTTTYLHDGQSMIREMSTATADYIFGPDIDEPLSVSRGGVISYFNVDALGSVATLSDSTGALQNLYEYDTWGVLRNQTGSVANPFTYTARESAEAGLMYYRARDYNPGIGRFVSEDPLRIKAGINFYAYVRNNPVIRKDPSGLVTWHCKYSIYGIIEGVGAGVFAAECTSDCVCGKEVHAYVGPATVVGVGAGIPVEGYNSFADLEDGYACANAQNLVGQLELGSAGGAFGIWGGSCWDLRIGSAHASGCSGQTGGGAGISIWEGASYVHDVTEKKCCP